MSTWVPEGPLDLWTHPPFDPVIEGDWLYGRGGGDMKAGHAANLFALDALARLGLQPAAAVTIQSVVEEESPATARSRPICAATGPTPC